MNYRFQFDFSLAKQLKKRYDVFTKTITYLEKKGCAEQWYR